MEKNYIKILWKIEELWKKYHTCYSELAVEPSINIDVSGNYNVNTISKYYNRFYLVDNFDFSPSKFPVFSDNYGEYNGLEKCQVMYPYKKLNDNKPGLLSLGKPIYLMDNHNEMLYSMVEIAQATSTQYDVVHIDAHPDDAKFPNKKPRKIILKNCDKPNLSQVDVISVGDVISETRISDFFDAISETNIIGEIFRVTHSDSFEFFLPPEKPYILSLDIDIFGPEGNFAELKDKIRAIALAWSSADAVCIAMSPGFINQGFAQKIIEILK